MLKSTWGLHKGIQKDKYISRAKWLSNLQPLEFYWGLNYIFDILLFISLSLLKTTECKECLPLLLTILPNPENSPINILYNANRVDMMLGCDSHLIPDCCVNISAPVFTAVTFPLTQAILHTPINLAKHISIFQWKKTNAFDDSMACSVAPWKGQKCFSPTTCKDLRISKVCWPTSVSYPLGMNDHCLLGY